MRRCLLVWLAFAGCAQAASSPDDVTPSKDVGVVDDVAAESETRFADETAPSIDSAPAPEGALFDSIDDAPCVAGSRACTTSCKTPGDQTCVGGDFGKCTPKPGDPCSGLDCTGKGDGLEHTFYRDADLDGHGDPKGPVQGCTPSAGTTSSNDDCDDTRADVHPGAPEVCDRVDDNCDGAIDEGVHVGTFDQPFSSVPPCSTSDPASCKRGAYDFCRAKSSCYDGGFGPVELGPANGLFVCVSTASSPASLSGGWAEVNAAQPACSSDDMAGLRVCESAVHRAARGKGFGSGVLQIHAPSAWSFLGLPNERTKVFDALPWSELTSRHAGCHTGTESSWDCNSATHRYCAANGFPSGFGPVEYSSTGVSVVCVVP